MDSQMKLLWLHTPDDLNQAFSVRIHVFCEEQGYSRDMELDDLDASAWHLLLTVNEIPAATGRLFWLDLDTGIMGIGRLAVEKEWRGYGFGRILVQELEKKATELGAKSILLDAQTRAIGFYEKLGYTICGEEHMDGHVPHKQMNKTIKQNNT